MEQKSINNMERQRLKEEYSRLLPVYYDLRLSLIPIKFKSKLPDIPQWRSYQKERAPADVITEWFLNGVMRNVGTVCGKVSGIVCLDIDGQEGEKYLSGKVLPVTPTCRSKRGYKYLFRYPENITLPTRPAIVPQVDFLSDGHYVLIPPSVHPDGTDYKWVNGLSPEDVRLAEVPEWLTRLVMNSNWNNPANGNFKPKNWVEEKMSAIPNGQRNVSLTQLCGRWIAKGLTKPEVIALLKETNRAACKPPLAVEELATIFWSVLRLHERRNKFTSKTQV